MSRALKLILAIVIFIVAIVIVWNVIGALFHVAVFLIKALFAIIIAAIVVGIFYFAVRSRD
ncbi:hypothetical protein [Paramicrobacterium agarici]|uniref:Uncharacterized protein n=1 Tax=Paramicrobacterium agarici TaxID=630514 RepID=A0A2A9DY05_9MICO|nr:hypothetical protein [Microbacterium agarici]PFG31015.1 hypothetical protein ATJ78_1960 [Microbacterium agarici]TQO24079.1 hypothetical protein FB385_2949 [Microbacterium agarici]